MDVDSWHLPSSSAEREDWLLSSACAGRSRREWGGLEIVIIQQ